MGFLQLKKKHFIDILRHPDVGGGVTEHGGGGVAATAVPCVGTCVKPSAKKREH